MSSIRAVGLVIVDCSPMSGGYTVKGLGQPSHDDVLHEFAAHGAVEVYVYGGAGGLCSVAGAWTWSVGMGESW